MKNLVHLLTYIILRLTGLLLYILPLGFSYILARWIGNFAFQVLRFRRQIVMQNLRIAFAEEYSEAKISEIAAESYRQIAMSFIELLIAPKLLPQVEFTRENKGIDVFQEKLQPGKGLIVVAGHLGSWEMQGAAIAAAIKEPFTVAAAMQSNPFIDRFITGRRNYMGMRVAGSKAAMKLLIKALKSKEAIGLVADQNAGKNAVFVDFFGKIGATQPGPAQLCLKFGAPMVFSAAVRTGPGKFRIVSEQIDINEDDTVKTLTQHHVKILEKYIRQYPEQYLWLHRRWKRRPPEEL